MRGAAPKMKSKGRLDTTKLTLTPARAHTKAIRLLKTTCKFDVAHPDLEFEVGVIGAST